jgi:putative peptidoglycan lipid II flippase
MEKFINNTKKFIFLKQKDILSSVLILGLMIIISRIFGFLRFRTLTVFFSKEELDIFFASFRLPDIVFEILISGALTSAFIPIFIKYEKNQEELNNNISSIINFMMLGLFIFIFIIFITSGYLIPLITPGFSSKNINYIITFSRMLLIGQLPFLVLGNILSGIAQANKIFIITAIAPIVYNLAIILTTIFLSRSLWIYSPFIGVIFGALLFFLVQIPLIFTINFKYYISTLKKGVLVEFIKLFLPRVFSVITAQIDLTVDLTLSSLLGPGSYTIFFFAQHLQLFPVSLVGMAFGQASLPYLSELYKDNKISEIKKIFIDSILQILFLTIPVSFFFLFARTPIVRLFFGGEKFDWEGTNQTALVLSYFTISIPFHGIFYFIVRSFYALHDTKTPFLISLFSVLTNTFLSLFFVFILKLPVWSLAISFSISIIVNVLFLLWSFYKKTRGFEVGHLLKSTIKIYFASIVSSCFSYPLMKLFDQLILDTSRTINVFFLIIIISSLYLLLYLFLSWLLSIEEIYILGKMLIKIKDMKKKMIEVYTEVG